MRNNKGQFVPLDLIGKVVGKLIVSSFAYKNTYGRYWNCICECGGTSIVITTKLNKGITKSCGCVKYRKGQNRKHGLKNHPLYSVWNGMKYRCLNKKAPNYSDYGGRGIKVCDRWSNSAKAFYDDMVKEYTKGLHLDRIDNDGDYCPENCRWVTPQENQNNKRTNVYVTFDGRTHTPAQWGRELGIKDNTIANRKLKGWTDYEALFGLK